MFAHLLQEIDLRTAGDGIPEQEGALAHGSFNERGKLRQIGVCIELKAKIKQAGDVKLPILRQYADDPLACCKSLLWRETFHDSSVMENLGRCACSMATEVCQIHINDNQCIS